MSQDISGSPGAESTGNRKAAQASKLPSLTGLRWLAAFMVFGFHIGLLDVVSAGAPHRAWDRVFGQGGSGVSFFFVLSGFVLTWSARSGDTALRFWRRRFAKIYPNHAATWAAVIVVMLCWGDTVDFEHAGAVLALVQPWLNFDNLSFSINPVSWSLACEAFFYLCFPLVLPLVRRASVPVLYTCAALLWFGIYYAGVLASHMPPSDGGWFAYLFPPVRSLEFWLGVAVGELFVRGRWVGPGLWSGTATAVAAYLATCRLGWFPVAIPPQWWPASLALAYTVLIAGAAKGDLAGTWSPWRTRLLVRLGELSFAFYLVHIQLIMNVMRLRHRVGRGWPAGEAAVVILALLTASLLLAWLLYRLVEVPMMRLLGPKRRPERDRTRIGGGGGGGDTGGDDTGRGNSLSATAAEPYEPALPGRGIPADL